MVKGIILAGGKGTRLQPLTFAIPKPILPVGGRPVIDYAIENLKTCKAIDTIYLGVSHMREVMEHYFHHVDYGLPIELVMTPAWETGGDLFTILKEKKVKETVVVAYGDLVTKLNVQHLLDFHKKTGRLATVALFEVPPEDAQRFGIAEIEGTYVTRFVEKPKPGTMPSRLANAGYYVLGPAAFEQLTNEKVKVEEKLFPRLASQGQLAGYVVRMPYWLDIGTVESYRKANRMIEGILAPPTTPR